MLKALIFDVDGTLALTERDGHRVAFNQAFAEAGLDWVWSEEEYGSLLKVTGGRERLRHYMAISGLPESTSLINRVHEIKTDRYIQIVNAGAIHLRPGIRRLTAEARAAGLKLGIATTTSRASIDALLAFWLPDVFTVLSTAEDAVEKKPDPLVYRVALERLGVSPDECIALEDSAAGLGASVGAGIPTVVTVNEYTRDEVFHGARSVLSDLGEPGTPPDVLVGDPPTNGIVDVAYLRQLVERPLQWHEATD